jgi:hypothetical protein
MQKGIVPLKTLLVVGGLIAILILIIAFGMLRKETGPSLNLMATANLAAENQQRRILNLPEIKPTWYLYKTSPDKIDQFEYYSELWFIKNGNPPRAKVVNRDKTGTILNETNIYYSGKKYLTPDVDAGPVDERLLVSHMYIPMPRSTTTIINGTLDYEGADASIRAMLDNVKTNAPLEEKLSVADQILGKWGMTRLDEQEKETEK